MESNAGTPRTTRAVQCYNEVCVKRTYVRCLYLNEDRGAKPSTPKSHREPFSRHVEFEIEARPGTSCVGERVVTSLGSPSAVAHYDCPHEFLSPCQKQPRGSEEPVSDPVAGTTPEERERKNLRSVTIDVCSVL